MRASTGLLAALLLTATAAGAHPETAVKDSHRPAEDVARDADRKPAAMLEFAKVDHGKKVVDFIPGTGYWTRLFAVAVKPGGSVVAIIPAAAADHDKPAAAAVASLGTDAAYGDVTVVASPLDPAAANLDVFFTAQNYHDLHNAPQGTVEGLNKAVFAALKPGGYYVVIDHSAGTAVPGQSLLLMGVGGGGTAAPPADVTKRLHRIDPAVVKAEVVAAGFVFDGESNALANPADDHSKPVFDPAIRGKTDQFAYRFKKPM